MSFFARIANIEETISVASKYDNEITVDSALDLVVNYPHLFTFKEIPRDYKDYSAWSIWSPDFKQDLTLQLGHLGRLPRAEVITLKLELIKKYLEEQKYIWSRFKYQDSIRESEIGDFTCFIVVPLCVGKRFDSKTQIKEYLIQQHYNEFPSLTSEEYLFYEAISSELLETTKDIEVNDTESIGIRPLRILKNYEKDVF